jgi:hypothetical protein
MPREHKIPEDFCARLAEVALDMHLRRVPAALPLRSRLWLALFSSLGTTQRQYSLTAGAASPIFPAEKFVSVCVDDELQRLLHYSAPRARTGLGGLQVLSRAEIVVAQIAFYFVVEPRGDNRVVCSGSRGE